MLFLTGLHEGGIDDVDEAAFAGKSADVRNGRGNGLVEAWPLIATENAEMARRLVPLNHEPSVGPRSGAKASVPSEIFFGEVEAPARRVDIGALEAIPEIP